MSQHDGVYTLGDGVTADGAGAWKQVGPGHKSIDIVVSAGAPSIQIEEGVTPDDPVAVSAAYTSSQSLEITSSRPWMRYRKTGGTGTARIIVSVAGLS